jgi:small-conductance mechanosensitive channel
MENAAKYHDGGETEGAEDKPAEGAGGEVKTEEAAEQGADAKPAKSQEVKKEEKEGGKEKEEQKEQQSRHNKRIRDMVSQNKALKEQNMELLEKLKKYEGKKKEDMTARDQLEQAKAQMEIESVAAERAKLQEENGAIIQSYASNLGEAGEDFKYNYNEYVPIMSRECPALIEEILEQGGDIYPFILDKFMEALNEGTESIDKWSKLPRPAVRAQIKLVVDKANDFLSNPSKYLTPEQMREIDPGYAPPKASEPKPASIVPKQSKAAAKDPRYSDGSYFHKLINDKLNDLS